MKWIRRISDKPANLDQVKGKTHAISHDSYRFSSIININMDDRETYEAIWEELKLIGYQEGDDVLYFHFIEACDYSNVNYFDINIEEFEEAMGVNVG